MMLKTRGKEKADEDPDNEQQRSCNIESLFAYHNDEHPPDELKRIADQQSVLYQK